MKTSTKIFTSIIALILSAVLAFFVVGNTQETKCASKRTVLLQENAVDYATFFNKFEDAELIIDEKNNALKFSGKQTLDKSLLEEIDLVNLSEDEKGIDVRYIFDYNADDNEFYLSVIADTENGEIIDNWFGVPYMTYEDEIDIAFATDEGIVYLSELEASGVLENCGWFSSKLKKLAAGLAIAAAIVAVVAVVMVAAPAVAAAAAAVTTAVSVGGSAAALTAGTATAALAAAATAGATVMASTAFAITATTAAVAAALAAGVYIADTTLQLVDDSTFINTLKKVRVLAASILATIAELTMDRIYQFAYLAPSGLIVLSTKMNYLEAYAVLIASGIINSSASGALAGKLKNLILPSELTSLVNTIKGKNIKDGYAGIYTLEEKNAAKLAYAAGGFFKGKAESEVHDSTTGSGYYYHFHDFTHTIHVWYGYAF